MQNEKGDTRKLDHDRSLTPPGDQNKDKNKPAAKRKLDHDRSFPPA